MSSQNLHRHHKIPKHIGGSESLDNLIYVTIDEHAELHRILFEKYGRWQDKLAWQGLSGMITKKELIYQKTLISSKKGAQISNEKQGVGIGSRKGEGKYIDGGKKSISMKNNKNGCKKYILIKNEVEIIVDDLVKFCIDNNLNYKSFHKQVIERNKKHRGFSIRG